jgi:hypothetical protein
MITTSVMEKKKRRTHYVINADFYDALIKYKDRVKQAEEKEQPKPRIPEYIGKCFLEIANHLAFTPKFINYSYKDLMISDGYTDCVKYVLNFDPYFKGGKTVKNPFSYFTTICYWAFVRRIKQEKKTLELYDMLLEKNGFDEVFHDDSADGDYSNYSDFNSIKDSVHSRMRY